MGKEDKEKCPLNFNGLFMFVNKSSIVRFYVLTAATMKITAFWEPDRPVDALRTSETSAYFN
jgi:hypothetical protein